MDGVTVLDPDSILVGVFHYKPPDLGAAKDDVPKEIPGAILALRKEGESGLFAAKGGTMPLTWISINSFTLDAKLVPTVEDVLEGSEVSDGPSEEPVESGPFGGGVRRRGRN